jgi:hypothetical protein
MFLAAALLPTAVPLAAGSAIADPYQPPALPRPQVVLVYDFSNTPGDVQLDAGVGSRLTSLFASQSSMEQKRAEAAADVVNAIGDTLVKQIQSLGLYAQRVPAGTSPPTYAIAAIVEGQVLDIDEGNRTRRTIIGFGAGASKVQADAQLSYQSQDGGSQLLIGYDDSGKSRATPGMAVTMGVGGLAGRAATSAVLGGGLHAYSETHGATVSADGARMAKDLAKQLAKYFATLGWIPPGTMPED